MLQEIGYDKNRVKTWIEYIFIVLTILQCNSIFLFHPGHIKIIINLLWQIILLSFTINSSFYNKFILDKQRLIIFLFMFLSFGLIFFVCELFYYPNFPKFYIITLLVDPLLLIIYFVNSAFRYRGFYICNNLLIKFENIMIILSIISLLFWIISLLHIPTTSSLTTLGWYDSNNITSVPSYFDIGFVVKGGTVSVLGFDFIRNTGIFTEPSMFSYSLMIALFIELFIKSGHKIITRQLIILFITMISTVSTTGIVFSILAFISDLIIKNRKPIYKLFLIIIIPVSIIVLRHIILGKVSSDPTSSYAIRSDDMQATIRAWQNHIFLGNGLGNSNATLAYIQPWRFLAGHAGISVGFTFALACGGLFLGMFYLLPLMCSFMVSFNIANFAIFSVIPLLFVGTQYSYLCIIIISYIWSCFILKTKNIKENEGKMS